MRESNVLRQCWLAVAALGTTLFRVNTGKAWVGNGVRQPDGNVLVIGGRPVALGFGMPNGDPLVGTSDLVGWTTLEITPAMVGRKIAAFTVIETKESGGGTKREAQVNFVNRVKEAGGIAGFASSPAQAQSIIREYSGGI
jgi:hypothetical protein